MRKPNKGFNLDWWAFATLQVFELRWFSDSFTVCKRKMVGRITSKLTPTLGSRKKNNKKWILGKKVAIC